MMFRPAISAVTLWLLMFLSWEGAAQAATSHHEHMGPRSAHVSMPALTIAQMQVMARYRSAVLDLASKETVTDAAFHRLVNYGNVEYAYCLWGLAPNAIEDETNPFHGCSSAYLAASHALLEHMQMMPQGADAAFQLMRRIDGDMYKLGTSWDMCAAGVDPFNTSQLPPPNLKAIARQPQTLVIFTLFLLTLTLGVLAWRFRLSKR